MIQKSNYKAQQSLNKKYREIKGAIAIDDVAEGFGRGWIIFAILSSMASAFSFYQDFNKSLGVVITIFIVTILAVALEGFKHFSIKGMFSSMNIISRSLVTVVALWLVGISFHTHYKSIKTFQKNLVGDDLRAEINYQRDLQKVQNGQINSILESNVELSKALNNGSKSDDKPSSDTVQSNNQLIATLKELAIKNNTINTALLLQESRSTAKTTASAILVIFFMIEIMALFSILSKIIIIDNVSENVKEFFGLIDKLDELETNTYQSLGYQKVEETKEKIEAVQEQQKIIHKEEIDKIKTEKHTPPTPQKDEEKKEITFNPMAYKTVPFYNRYFGYKPKNTNPTQSPQIDGLYGKYNTVKNGMKMTVYPNTTPVKYSKNNTSDSHRMTDNQMYQKLQKIDKIVDFEGNIWLYYEKWIIEEDSCSNSTISKRVGERLEDGFTTENLLLKTSKEFIINGVMNQSKYRQEWICRVEEMNEKYPNSVEAEIIPEPKEETVVNPFNEKVPALDLKIYSPDEQKLLKELYDNGAITIGQNLIGRRHVLRAVGKMKKKSETLSLLYEKLFENGYIDKKQVNPNNAIYKYIALAELHHHNWQDKP